MGGAEAQFSVASLWFISSFGPQSISSTYAKANVLLVACERCGMSGCC